MDIRSKTQSEKNLNSKLNNFSLKTQISGKIFRNLRRFSTKCNYFCLKSGKIYQKLKSLPKTQGKISKNLKFPVNPLSSKAIKTSKKPDLGKVILGSVNFISSCVIVDQIGPNRRRRPGWRGWPSRQSSPRVSQQP